MQSRKQLRKADGSMLKRACNTCTALDVRSKQLLDSFPSKFLLFNDESLKRAWFGGQQ
jgi:hypothetical protein